MCLHVASPRHAWTASPTHKVPWVLIALLMHVTHGSPGIGVPLLQRSVHWLWHREPAAQAQSLTTPLINALYAFTSPFTQHVPQSTHDAGVILHVSPVSMRGHMSQFMPPAASHVPPEAVDIDDEAVGVPVIVLMVLVLALEPVLGTDDGPLVVVPPPPPAESPALPLSLEHAAKAKETDTATEAQNLMTTPPQNLTRK